MSSMSGVSAPAASARRHRFLVHYESCGVAATVDLSGRNKAHVKRRFEEIYQGDTFVDAVRMDRALVMAEYRRVAV